MKIKLFVLFCFFCSLSLCLHAQKGTNPIPNDTIYRLSGDTLFTNKDFKIFIGQKLIVGTGSNINGWYKTISLNSVFDWYGLTLGVFGIQNTEEPIEKEIRDNNIIKDCMRDEEVLNVKKIKQYSNKRQGKWHEVILRSQPGKPNSNYKCTIEEAIRTGEILLAPLVINQSTIILK
jgi:hypothetical protein